MKNYIAYISAVFISLVVVSCVQKEFMPSEGKEVVIGVAGLSSVSVTETKTTAVTSLPGSLYWGATSGMRGALAETRKWNVASGSVVGSTLPTGQFVTVPEVLNYYVSNHTFTVPATGNITMNVDNSMDVVAGWTASATDSNTPSVTLNHIFARTGSLTLNLPVGYSSSGVSWSIKGKGALTGTAGTYNLSTGAWTASSASLDYTTITSGSDLYLMPGDYDVKITFTAAKGGFSKTYTQVGTVTMVAGKRNNIIASSSSDDAPEIIISLSLTPWDTLPLVANIGPKKYSFAGLEIAPGNLYKSGVSTFNMLTRWDDSAGDSEYISFYQLGNKFQSPFDGKSDIVNTLDPFDGWRLPTRAEWLTITRGVSPGVSRPGSTVNGNSGVKFTIVYVDDTVYCLLLFPDGETITGSPLLDYTNGFPTTVTSLTTSEVNTYTSQGCACLSSMGYYNTYASTPEYWLEEGYYMSSTYYDNGNDCYMALEFGASGYVPVQVRGQGYYPSVRLVREID